MSACLVRTPSAVDSASTVAETTRYSSVRLQVEIAAASWLPSEEVSSRSAPTALPSVSESRSRRSSGAVLWETPSARSSDTSRRLLRFAAGGGLVVLVPLGDLG